MKLQAIIVDDEAPARRRMKKLLSSVADCELIGEAESGFQAIQIINSLKPDLLLLDIQLKDMTGFDVLRSVDIPDLKIIFITAYDSYAIQAFEENAIDYLLKPYKEVRFYEALERVKDRTSSSDDKSLSKLFEYISKGVEKTKLRIPEGKTTHLMDSTLIQFIHSNTYYCNFHYDGQTEKMIRISLKALESILPDNFVRVNKSLIINKDKILSIRNLKSTIEVELSNNTKFSFGNQKGIAGKLS